MDKEFATDYVVFDKENQFVTRGMVKDFIPLPLTESLKSTFRIVRTEKRRSEFSKQMVKDIQIKEVGSTIDDMHALMAGYMKRGCAVAIIRQYYEEQGFKVTFANNTGNFIACANPDCGHRTARREPALFYYCPCLDCRHIKHRQKIRRDKKLYKNKKVKGFEITFGNNINKYIACDRPKEYFPDGKDGWKAKCSYYSLPEPEPGKLPQVYSYDGFCLDCHLANGADPAKLLSLWPILIDCVVLMGMITKRQGEVLYYQIVHPYIKTKKEIADHFGVTVRNINDLLKKIDDNCKSFKEKSQKTSKRLPKAQHTYRELAEFVAQLICQRGQKYKWPVTGRGGWGLLLREYIESERGDALKQLENKASPDGWQPHKFDKDLKSDQSTKIIF